jgi:hypothetical protein
MGVSTGCRRIAALQKSAIDFDGLHARRDATCTDRHVEVPGGAIAHEPVHRRRPPSRPPPGTVWHRLNRDGTRPLNQALYAIAISDIGAGTGARASYERKRAEGKTSREALRCLRRRLSDVVYRAPRARLCAGQRPTDRTGVGLALLERPSCATPACAEFDYTTGDAPPQPWRSTRTATREWSWSCPATARCARPWTSTATSCLPGPAKWPTGRSSGDSNP